MSQDDRNPLSIKNYLSRKSISASRAYSQFVSDKDCDVILERNNETSAIDFQSESFNFSTYLFGRNHTGQTEQVTCFFIEAEDQVLVNLVHEYNPDFEDARLSQQPMSRKR
jgi:hypothetical protein